MTLEIGEMFIFIWWFPEKQVEIDLEVDICLL